MKPPSRIRLDPAKRVLFLTKDPDLLRRQLSGELNLHNATASVSFTADGVKYTRELWASTPDNVIVMRLTADTPAKHGVELVQHHGGEQGEDDQFEDLQGGDRV